MQKIMIVEDDENLQELVLYALSSAGFAGEGFEDGKSLFEALGSAVPKLIILDIMLPGEDGISILKNLKSDFAYRAIPVIMLTAKGSELDKVRGLDLGADDYITKPFSVLELISRVKAVLRRASGSDTKVIEIHNLIIDKDRRIVIAGEENINLTYKEFELLLYLVQNKGIVLSREKIMDNVWGFDFEGESRTVDMHIKTLRQKLPGSGDIIKTVRNVGYKIEG